MAQLNFDDGSSLDLTPDELVLYLKATGKYVEPKSEARKVAEAMMAVRNAEQQGAVATQVVADPELTEAVNEALADVTPAVMPEHPAPTVRPRRIAPAYLPVTKDEYHIYEQLLSHPNGLTTKDLVVLTGWKKMKISGHLSKMFQQERGIYKGTRNRWYLRDWARKADPRIMTYPNSNWPPKEGLPT